MTRLLLWLSLVGILGLGVPAARADVTLTVTSLDGGTDVDFGGARSLGSQGELEAETVTRRIRVTVTSTSGKPYQVFQRLSGPWVNERGTAIPPDAVHFFLSGTTTSGIVRVPDPKPMHITDEELFLSNAQGANEEFIITYTIRVPVGQTAGRYRANLTLRVVSQ